MRIRYMLALFAFIFFSYSNGVSAESLDKNYMDVTKSELENTIILSPESSIGFINGHKVEAVQPIVREGKILVPLRFISEGFGANVDFNKEKSLITIKYNNLIISSKLKSKTIFIDGKSKIMDVAPTLYKNATYIPLRELGEAFNKKVVYLKKSEFQSHNLIFLRNIDSSAIENLRLTSALQLILQGKNIVYSDKYMAVIKENDHLLFSNDFYYFAPFSYQENIKNELEVKLGDFWIDTAMGQFYINYDYNLSRDFILYNVKGEVITRVAIEQAPIKSVKTYQDNVYYLTRYERSIQNPELTTNLKTAKLINGKWASDYLGKQGFYYGYDIEGKSYDWEIDDHGVSTLGFHRFADLTKDEKLKTLGYYIIKPNGQDHQFVK